MHFVCAVLAAGDFGAGSLPDCVVAHTPISNYRHHGERCFSFAERDFYIAGAVIARTAYDLGNLAEHGRVRFRKQRGAARNPARNRAIIGPVSGSWDCLYPVENAVETEQASFE